MDENHTEEEEKPLEEASVIKMLPPSITDTEKGHLFKELTTILSRKWVKDRITVFGCSELDLLLATKFDVVTLQETLEEYKSFVKIIGLDLVEYDLEGEQWYCLKSSYYAPSELEQTELILLGIIIALIEEENTISVTTEKIKEKLVLSGKMKEYLIDLGLRNLVKLGYIQRKNNSWIYGYRILIEYGNNERKKISEEFRII